MNRRHADRLRVRVLTALGLGMAGPAMALGCGGVTSGESGELGNGETSREQDAAAGVDASSPADADVVSPEGRQVFRAWKAGTPEHRCHVPDLPIVSVAQCPPPGEDGCCNPYTGPYYVEGHCCYGPPLSSGCCGRPFTVEGEARVAPVIRRGDWQARRGRTADEALPRAVRAQLATRWLEEARLEHASIASFSRFTLDLLAVGAPPELVEASVAASSDEIRHARQCFEQASRYADEPVGPGSLDTQDATPIRSLEDVVRAAFREGCLGESCAALILHERAALAEDPELSDRLARMAEDEAQHAELGWRFIRWAVEERGASIRRVLEDELARVMDSASSSAAPPSDLDAMSDATLGAHGLVSAEAAAALMRAGVQRVVLPCTRALLA